MNPHQRNKVDISVSTSDSPLYHVSRLGGPVNMIILTLGHLKSLNEEEQKLFRLYGKLPNKKDLLQNKLKVCLSPHPYPLSSV